MTFFEKAAIVGVWGVAIAAVAIMKKIEPENKVYPFWALALAAINMIVIIWGFTLIILPLQVNKTV